MYVNVNNDERPDFGETAKTTTRTVLQRYFDYVDILYLQSYLLITKLFYFHIFRIIHAFYNTKNVIRTYKSQGEFVA